MAQLAALGYATASDDEIGPDGAKATWAAYAEVVPTDRLEAAIARLNPALSPEARADTICRVTRSELPQLLEENRRIHRLLTEGADVEHYGDDGVLTAGEVKLIDFERPGVDDWLAAQQLTDVAGQTRRRPDAVVFVNGLPLAVIERKAPVCAAQQVSTARPAFDVTRTAVSNGRQRDRHRRPRNRIDLHPTDHHRRGGYRHHNQTTSAANTL